ncbi:MAG TPA: EAL domain-containing response regulator [Alphaproteobacteria bacterium]|nr:EAL domain-containing response regulator [Alphaproteobacteria bacterium]
MQSTRARPYPPGGPRGHLAVLDDEPLFCEFVGEAGEQAGYEAFTTTDPDNFLERIELVPPALIVLDLLMPGMDGMQVIRHLARSGMKACILLASGADDRFLDTAICLGRALGLNMTGVIRKPIDIDALCKLLESQVEADSPLTAERFRLAIAAGELTLHYQPIWNLKERRIVEVEALTRWRHPQLGLLMPSAFIAMAEEAGLIAHMTDWALAEAVNQAAAWRAQGLALKVAVNVSIAGLRDERLPERLERLCHEADLPTSAIALELTETAATQNPARVMEILVRLRSKGFELSIDDFGTGYSSLAQLQRLPFTALKIDRSFVASVLKSESSAAIVLAVISLSRALGLTCVAEGVENDEILAFLTQHGCDAAQGYGLGRPMPGAEITALLRQ